ncbi:MAG: ABC transporter ATP-binding protein, partial [Candidatus Methanomethyliaceae archaeon]
MKTDVRLESVTKRFGAVVAIDNLNLDVQPGELLTLLGPSGCGKTTVLRLIAGFYTPETGRVLIGGIEVTRVPANKRHTAMVFQSYALFPHMNVWHNIAYGLKIRKIKREEIVKKVNNMLELIGLCGLEKRFPHQLSGGQQQRVALARALVVEPKVLLLDEPLSNLDAKLRVETRGYIRQLQKSVGITSIYVTHDQAEALAISDRIAVLNSGRLQQLGAPEEIYRHPKNVFVAEFIGRANCIKATAIEVSPSMVKLRLAGGQELWVPKTTNATPGEQFVLIIRPESIQFVSPSQGELTGKVMA